MQEELFTTTELTSFGNYLLSRGRSLSILDSESDVDATTLLSQVHHADFENWKAKCGEAGVAMLTESDDTLRQARQSVKRIREAEANAAYLKPASDMGETGVLRLVSSDGNWAMDGPRPQAETPRTVRLVDTPLVL